MSFEAARLVVTVEEQGIDKTTSELRGLDGQVEKTGSSFGNLSTMVKGFAVGVVLQQAGQIMYDMARAAAEDAASVAQLEQAVVNAEGSLGRHAAAMDEAVAAGQRMAFADDQVRQALALMTATTGDADEALRRLGTAQDLARGTGMDLVTAAKLLGRVNDENINVLSRYGIQVEKTASAQDLLNAVDQKFAGQAGKYAESDLAKFERMNIAIGELQESLGVLLLPALATVATEVTETANAVGIISGKLNELAGIIPGASANLGIFGYYAKSVASGGMLPMLDSLQWLADKFDDTETEASTLIPVIYRVAAAINELEKEAAEASPQVTELRGALTNLFMKDNAGGMSGAGMVGKSIQEIAEAAQIAKGELTEFASASEMVATSVARANQELAFMGEASREAIEGQANLTTAWNNATSAMGFWEQNLSNAEQALGILDGEMAENGSLTAEQQRQYDILTGAVGRYTGGIEDSEGAVVDAAVAQAEFIRTQDELNTKLASGEISAGDYARAMADASAETDPAASSAYNLAGAQGDLQLAIEGVVNKLGNLLIDLGLLPESKRTEFQTPGMDDAKRNTDELHGKIDEVPDAHSTTVDTPGAYDAQLALNEVTQAANNVPKSLTIDAHVNIAAAVNALNELRGMTFTQSPPKEGPMAFVPDWSYLFEGLDTAAEEFGTKAMERIKGYVTGLDLGNILADQVDLTGTIAELEAVHAGLLQLGETDAAAALAEEIARLNLEAATLAAIIGTDAVQAWLTNQDAAKAAAEAAALALEEQQAAADAAKAKIDALNQSYHDLITGISQGGDATAKFLADLVADAAQAEQALNWGQMLGLPPEVLEQLQADFDEAAGLLETGSVYLVKALEAGLIDEATLQALAEAGGEWFQAIYDSLFGEGALAQMEAGWNDLTDQAIAQIGELIGQMENGGAEIIGTLVDAISSGAVSFEEALGLLADVTGEQVNEIIAELERLQTALIVELAEALATGSDPSEIEANLAIIDQLLAALADRAVSTAEAVVKAGTSMITWSAKAAAAASAAAESIDKVSRSARKAENNVRKLSGSLEQVIVDSFIFTGNPAHRGGMPGSRQYEETLAGVIDRMRSARALDPARFADEYVSAVERIERGLQEAIVMNRDSRVTSLTAHYNAMIRVAAALGVDLSETLGQELESAATTAQQQLATTLAPSGTTGVSPAPLSPLAPLPPLPPTTGQRETFVAELSGAQFDALVSAVREGVTSGSANGTARGAEAGTVAGWRSIQSGSRVVTGLVG